MQNKQANETRIGQYTTSREAVVVGGLLLLAVLTRGYGLGDWPFAGDEYFTVMEAEERFQSLLNPAIYALVTMMFKLFGESEWTARFPAFLLGALSIPVFYLTWRRVIGKNAALWAALFILVSSWHLWCSQFSRFYAGVFLFGSLSYYLYYQAVTRDRLDYLVGTLFASLITVLFHLTAVMVPVSCGLFSVMLLLWKGPQATGYSRRIAAIYVAICGVVALIAAPWVWEIVTMWHSKGQAWGHGPPKFILQLIAYIQIPLAISAFLGMIWLLQKTPIKGLFFAIGAGIPVLALIVGSAVLTIRPHYMFYALPLIFALAGLLCEAVGQTLRGYWIAPYALVIVVLFSMMPGTVSHYTIRASLDIRNLVAFVEDEYQPGDRILFNAAGQPFEYYASRNYPILPRTGNPYNNQIEWQEILNKYRHNGYRVWCILPIRRSPLAPSLENWLLDHASLEWREYAKGYDYAVKGYQIFLIPGGAEASSEHSS